MIFTSRFSNPELATRKYTVVGIVRGLPRFGLKYELAGNIYDIAPPRELFHIYNREEFTPPYMAHLDRVGIDKIKAQLQKYLDIGKDVVLCCYEDVRKPDEWCHRLVFASWWEQRTGLTIPELEDTSLIKGKVVASTRTQVHEDRTFDLHLEHSEKLRIWSVYSLWNENGEWHGGDMFYKVDQATGKKTRIADAVAQDLLTQGKAELVQDEDSKARIRFVLFDEPASKAYWLAKDGTEREMNLETALKFIMENKARIQDIRIGQKPEN